MWISVNDTSPVKDSDVAKPLSTLHAIVLLNQKEKQKKIKIKKTQKKQKKKKKKTNKKTKQNKKKRKEKEKTKQNKTKQNKTKTTLFLFARCITSSYCNWCGCKIQLQKRLMILLHLPSIVWMVIIHTKNES